MSGRARSPRPPRPGRPAGQRAQGTGGAGKGAAGTGKGGAGKGGAGKGGAGTRGAGATAAAKGRARPAAQQPAPAPAAPAEPFRLTYVEGSTPSKWIRAWIERMPQPLVHDRLEVERQDRGLRSGEADAAIVRLPIDEEGLHLVRLYDERAFVVVPSEHPIAEMDAVVAADLEGEPTIARGGMTWRELMEVVGSGAGIATMPQSLARLHHRRDVAAVPIEDAPPTTIALAWRRDRDGADVQALVAIARGRSARSSR
ncbi:MULTISPECIES: LysR family transcriptional regulator substrate-binding protein [unclassified Agrococcus]|uniref:LysR family transcriptional regulator substrate-binding protein n=1 Tax=unclassified Agrococcus TaxID=2615065 RepID=UPI00361E5015